jgi:hypothetical protein
MPIIALNRLIFTGRLDSSLPTSYVSPHVASVLTTLDDVSVTIGLSECGDEDESFSCVLNFTIFERLVSDCVLGVDFFMHINTCLRTNLMSLKCCLLIKKFVVRSTIHHLNDDQYSCFMIDVICALHEIISCLYQTDISIVSLQSLLSSHGSSFDNSSVENMVHVFFCHVLHGMCAYNGGHRCRLTSGLSMVEISRRLFSIVFRAPFSILMFICESLGFHINFEHQSITPLDVLNDYKVKISTFKQLLAQDFFSHTMTTSSFSDLIFLAACHGLSRINDPTVCRQTLLHHFCYGECFQNYSFEIPVGCLQTRKMWTTKIYIIQLIFKLHSFMKLVKS